MSECHYFGPQNAFFNINNKSSVPGLAASKFDKSLRGLDNVFKQKGSLSGKDN